ncbi:pentatricopeptide repeat-containing protein At2g22410, mitochondrial-like [Salvia miltiorrhiza]|uniref:pentatricopeptide repeat-containing protein At2g22410, mitochondrial-like n=1 Tax=Salvia miltiorrhiza TaxID=226208 RepID=UPI0025ACCD47|nr:pentatricopeptide repeat-containing protein At2g22410, mitochondrial-like [Salvia miltiorrhiza]
MSHLKALQAQITIHGLAGDAVSVSKLVSFCALSASGDLHYAHYLFEKITQPNRHIYNTLIRAFSCGRSSDKAIFLYLKMVRFGISPNEFTFPSLLKACAFQKACVEGISVHLQALKLGFSESYVMVQNGFINFYASCGMIECARKVFDRMEFTNLVSWNSMINGYAKVGLWEEAFLLFGGMREDGIEPNGRTFVSLLSVSSRIYDVELGKFVHWYIEINGAPSDTHMQNALLDMYAKCGHLQMAEAIFRRMADKNVVSWTSMVSAYAKHGLIEPAEIVFNWMPVKNVISWNSMISCYLQNGYYKESLELFYRMCGSCVIPDETTMTSVLSSCSQLGDLVQGKKLHDYLRDNGIRPSVTLCNALVDMYAKCGSVEEALDIFLNMPGKNTVSWNTIINALASHGSGHRAIELFQEMEASGMQPDAVTFSGLLSACCHCGLVETGRYYFSKMSQVYKIQYDIEHYACMIDILGRQGLLKEAVEVIGKMSVKPDIVIWGTLLGACRIHQNVPIARLVLKQILEVETYAGGLYVLISNIFSEAQQWEEMRKMRILMKDYGLRKTDAVSSIEVEGRVSEFMVDDKKHEGLISSTRRSTSSRITWRGSCRNLEPRCQWHF